MSARTWMPFYVADYLADTGHLSTVEHGAYMLLIMHYWQSGGLPDDERKLARICRMTPAEWEDSRETLADLFDDGWKHTRIEAEIERAAEKYRKRAEAGKKGGNAKASGKQCSSNATAMLYQPQPHSSNEESYTADARADDVSARMPELYAAVGVTDETKSPGLLTISEPIQWVSAGCDIDADILPALRSIAARGKTPKTWRYCSDAVFEARDRRLAPPPAVQTRRATAPPSKQTVGQQARDELKRMGMFDASDHETRHHDVGDGKPGFAGTGIARRIAIASGG